MENNYSQKCAFPEGEDSTPQLPEDYQSETTDISKDHKKESCLQRIAVLGNHLPRHCGIATFTSDLSRSIVEEFSMVECFVLAMNDGGKRYAYPPRVRFELTASDESSYHRAADFLNVSAVDVLSLQHEYGIFGGKAGSHILLLLRDLRMPIITTLHTILANPNSIQRTVMDEIITLSERLIVMSTHGVTVLHETYGVSKNKIDIVPHGIPQLPNANKSKHRLGVEGKSVILTFGLLSPDKGIEHVIDSLPSVLKRFPNAIYIVLGVTHPHVKDRNGESYRLMLENRAKKLGVDSAIIFHNRFVSQEELNEFLSAADIYITPYLKPEQSTSGTLAYAVGSGKAVISTPYSYASELLAEGRGLLIPWPKDDPDSISESIIELLEDDSKRLELGKKGAEYGRGMLWSDAARAYVNVFEQASIEHADRLHNVFKAKTLAERSGELPEVNLEHIKILSDSTGILQHASFSVPRYEDGYCLDDNARALLLTTLLEDVGIDEDANTIRSLAARYMAFVNHSFDVKSGKFRNFMSYDRKWLEKDGAEDCHGRALWALGTVIGHSNDPGKRNLADSLFHLALPRVEHFTSPRAAAYAVLGIDEYLRAFQGDSKVEGMLNLSGEKILHLFRQTSTHVWPWFENIVTYCNARLSQAMLICGNRLENREMTAAGLKSLLWLVDIQRTSNNDGYFAPIGSNGFYKKGSTKAAFDQQPVEACAMVSACLTAHRLTGKRQWTEEARRTFAWFIGQNQLQQPLYDPVTGACKDGLHSDRSNENQGAESTLSFLIALLEMRAATQSAKPFCVNINWQKSERITS